MRVKIFYHDHCFDGACSAAVFACFYRRAFDAQTEFSYAGLMHRPGGSFGEMQFDADEHALLDFKFHPSEKITWWFDHHQSAFLTVVDEALFRADTSGRKFFDPGYKSCTKFIADIARDRFGVELPELAELIHWADIIDGAQYPDAETAVNLSAPAMQLTLVLEGSKDHRLRQSIVKALQVRSLAEVAAEPEIQAAFAPIRARHERAIEIFRQVGECHDGVVFFDLTGYDIEGYNKFIAYWLYPQARYSVSVSRGAYRSKVSVGYNPWSGRPREHNIASICERYGGGGHAAVGAVSLAPEALERAKVIAREIAAELRDVSTGETTGETV
jgi:hypothetical protein